MSYMRALENNSSAGWRLIIVSIKLHWVLNSAYIGMAPKRTIRAELEQHVQSLGNGRRVEICVCRLGYHVYKNAWDRYMGDNFTTKHEPNNQYDNNVLLAITHAFARAVPKRRWYYVFRRRLKIIRKPMQGRLILGTKIRIALRALNLGRRLY